MSFFDLRRRSIEPGSWEGMKPPPFNPISIFEDLRWHFALYRNDQLPIRKIIGFLFLRVVQLYEYKKGWREGDKGA